MSREHDEFIFGYMDKIVPEPLHLPLGDHPVVGVFPIRGAERMRINTVTRVAHIIQPHEVDVADIEGVILGTPFPVERIEGVLICFSIKVEIVITAKQSIAVFCLRR